MTMTTLPFHKHETHQEALQKEHGHPRGANQIQKSGQVYKSGALPRWPKRGAFGTAQVIMMSFGKGSWGVGLRVGWSVMPSKPL